MIVSLRAPRSTQLLAPISTSSWMITRPDLRHLQVALGAHGEAEAVLADLTPGVQNDTVADQGVDHDAPGPM